MTTVSTRDMPRLHERRAGPMATPADRPGSATTALTAGLNAIVADVKDAAGRFSFEASVAECVPSDAALQRLAQIVHSADFADDIGLTPEGAGLRAISRGFPLVSLDDHDTVNRASYLYDAHYASLQEEMKS
jgi:hypothetical protein